MSEPAHSARVFGTVARRDAILMIVAGVVVLALALAAVALAVWAYCESDAGACEARAPGVVGIVIWWALPLAALAAALAAIGVAAMRSVRPGRVGMAGKLIVASAALSAAFFVFVALLS